MKSEVGNKIKRMWLEAVALGHKADLRKAQVGLLLLRTQKSEKAARKWARENLNMDSNRASWLVRCAKVLRDEIKDADVWIACGWTGVREIVKHEGKERADLVRAALKLYRDTQRQVSDHRVRALPGGSPKPRASNPAGSPRVRAQATSLLDHALEDLRKLAAFNPATLDLLSADVRAAVEARLKASA